MGQEAGKPTWPKPAGGYQTITGRRYGRRHAYVSFRPSLVNQERNANQLNSECEGLELDDVQKENSLCSSPLVQVCSALADVPLLANVGSEDPVSQADPSQAVVTDYASGEHNNLRGQNGISFVNIDSYEPDSSDGEEEGGQNDLSLVKEEAGIFQETLDNMLSELEKGWSVSNYSSECSDGEWSASLPSYFAVTVKDQSSSDESWETLPGKEEPEPEVQSDSSGVEEEHNDFGFQAGEQTILEDGEIPWLQYHEEIETSSDEETDQVSHFVHPGFFMLDGNNNLEDDSSMSEDLDVEWRYVVSSWC
ncbi:hypothetical protein JD844_008884 [Phrynosoma platyrhinos]|uniref:PJA2 ligase n=1 Tax=Phrynosoma platyrhinos TaxID=52577 RepID=A0ABQ7TEZ4_PHRPL|nr:hypothetical protein JD844_008884 [Phrynosoma platyrhinos]